MEHEVGAFGSFRDCISGYFAVFEDDGRVAYAYLLNPQQEFVADVWLYNRCQTPAEPEWTDPSRLPFANSSEFFKGAEVAAPVDDISDVTVQWQHSKDGRATAHVFIRNRLFGKFSEGDKPGWSLLAARDGPLAKVLD